MGTLCIKNKGEDANLFQCFCEVVPNVFKVEICKISLLSSKKKLEIFYKKFIFVSRGMSILKTIQLAPMNSFFKVNSTLTELMLRV